MSDAGRSPRAAMSTLAWATLLCCALAMGLSSVAHADTTFGGDPTLAADATVTDGWGSGGEALGCAYGEPFPELGTPTIPPPGQKPNNTCTWTWLGSSVGGPSDNVPFGAAGGSGTVTAVTLPAMPDPGPMQVVVFTGTVVIPQSSESGQTDFACCRVKEISPSFTVPADQIATVPLSLPVAATAAVTKTGETQTTDILGVSMLGTTGASMPLHFTANPGDYDLVTYPARSVTDPNIETMGETSEYELLAQFHLGSTPEPTPTPTPAPTPKPSPATSPAKGLKLAKALIFSGKGNAVVLGKATDPPTASTTQKLTGVLPGASKKKSKAITVASGKTKIATGKSAGMKVTLTKAALGALAERGVLKVKETIVAESPGGVAQTVSHTLELQMGKVKR
jgi:hypothetical protein